MIRKLLIANRGEIACRVIRGAREMGVRTVAVYSEADKDAMHVRLADEAVAIGPSEASLSYLSIDKILGAARSTGADAIHPGYGFLSERAEFAEACAAAAVIFVGPPASAMRKLGSKIEAKQLAVSAGVPVTPGFFEPGATSADLKRAAEGIGYPVMLKASAGGGGRGMRVVREAEYFDEEFRIASDEALKSFGDGAMMVEKLVDRPRHIEVQVLADSHGTVASLFERECSLQRRHQKIVEEAPSALLTTWAKSPMSADGTPAVPPSLWDRMRDASRSLISAAGYVGAGTVEFITDFEGRDFYFMEVNARLQVEHPVTEMVTSLDLVQWQLRIASGEALQIDQEILAGSRSAIKGHAIEARIVAEDPARDFLPSVGKIVAWAEPKAPGVRVDTGYGPGSEVSRYYDSLIAKVIAHAETRGQAIDKLRSALLDFHVLGVSTNIAYLLDILDSDGFRAGAIDTGFLGRDFGVWAPSSDLPEELAAIISAASSGAVSSEGPAVMQGAWGIADGFRNAHA